MSKKIFVTREIPEIGIAMLRSAGHNVTVGTFRKPPTKKEIIKALKSGEYDGVLTLLTDSIDQEVMDSAPSVKIYANYASGFDNLAIAEAQKRGIAVTNAPTNASSLSVAQFAITLMLTLMARITEADRFVKKGKYVGWSATNFVGSGMTGKKLGLIGAGRIGSQLALYAKALGFSVLYFDVKRNEVFEKECGATFCSSLDELLPESDVVSIHVPLLDSTRHLIDEKRLSSMKSSAFLINTSRGAVIDEKALEKALKKSVIAGAGLDVFEFEPKISRGLRKLENVILTPHIASASDSARIEMAKVTAQNIIDYFEGKAPANLVS